MRLREAARSPRSTEPGGRAGNSRKKFTSLVTRLPSTAKFAPIFVVPTTFTRRRPLISASISSPPATLAATWPNSLRDIASKRQVSVSCSRLAASITPGARMAGE